MPTDWFVKSGTGGTDDGSSWANAAESIAGLLAAQNVLGGDRILCHNTHNNTTSSGATLTWTLPESSTGVVQVLSVDGGDATGASLSGTTVGNLYFGAAEGSNGNYVLQIDTRANAGIYMYGMTISAGSGVSDSAGRITIGAGGGTTVLDNCVWYANTTFAVPNRLGATTNSSTVRLINSQFRFGAAGASIGLYGGQFSAENCKIHASSTAPTTLFTTVATYNGSLRCSGCDWSAATNVFSQTAAEAVSVMMNNCVIGTPVTGTHAGIGGTVAEFHACAGTAAGPLVTEYYYEDASGVVQDSTTVYPTSSPAQMKDDDGTLTSYSLQMDPRNSATYLDEFPLYTPWFSTYVGSTGSKTFTVRVADTESALLKDTELWLEVEYVGGAQTADSPQSQREGTFPLVSGTISRDITAAGSNLTDSAEAWTGITETGTYSLAKTVTVDEQGYIRCRVGLAKDTTNPVYVDPKIAVS